LLEANAEKHWQHHRHASFWAIWYRYG